LRFKQQTIARRNVEVKAGR